MSGKRVNLAYISNDAARKASYNRRKKGLAKKVSELTTLCGIHACMIIFSPYDFEPEIWPDLKEAQQVITWYQNTLEMDQRKNLKQESFIRQMIAKVSDQLKKQRKENCEKEMTLTMFQCLEGKRWDDMMIEDLNDMNYLIEKNIKDIDKKLDKLI